jgi:hypothetical protein
VPGLSSLNLERSRDLRGRGGHVWARRALLACFAAIALFALLGGVGQRATDLSTGGPAATMLLRSPSRVRGGLLYQARVTIRARRAIDQPRLVLGPGWFDGLTINTIEPDPSEQANHNGRVALHYDQLPAGRVLHVFVEYQVNPTTVGKKAQRLELDDGGTPLVTLQRQMTVLP